MVVVARPVSRCCDAVAALLLAVVAIACDRPDPASSLPQTPSEPSALEILRTAIAQSSSLPAPFACAGFDQEREVTLGGRYVVVLSCNRDGLLAVFAANGSLKATHTTSGKPVVLSVFADDESGSALDKLLVEEYAWGTGIQTREQVIYCVNEGNIVELWRREVFVRAGGGGIREQYLDGYALHRRGEVDRHGPLLVYGVRTSPRGPYNESVFEITRDAVRPYSGRVE
jgi:hypothetical protein